ncbi:Fe-S cluster assembly sulfur transfer protein SufU [Immundisolibacter sp.]|uniref:Fe-S cluster assembly sulfur transfer protein SufU n=1 Tax=Immundisolibacter sp. TaxID=1934948 RepID=UPI0026346471|nr:SUF system NifU family Fe-S cluster assembly protein [Immundisolibacter sp.]MDD3652019.1 SUF system NifU family Fe-S cluster assembly protein [Immundisolibacter sp.]
MSDLRDLYQELIVDHNKNPRNYGVLADANRRAEGYNPLCGDKVTVYLHVDGDRIADVSFEGAGCAISTASASLMTQAVKGKTVAEAEQLFEAFHAMVTGQDTSEETADRLGKLAVLAGVREYPSRVKCATLAWHTLHNAAHGEAVPAKTE